MTIPSWTSHMLSSCSLSEQLTLAMMLPCLVLLYFWSSEFGIVFEAFIRWFGIGGMLKLSDRIFLWLLFIRRPICKIQLIAAASSQNGNPWNLHIFEFMAHHWVKDIQSCVWKRCTVGRSTRVCATSDLAIHFALGSETSGILMAILYLFDWRIRVDWKPFLAVVTTHDAEVKGELRLVLLKSYHVQLIQLIIATMLETFICLLEIEGSW